MGKGDTTDDTDSFRVIRGTRLTGLFLDDVLPSPQSDSGVLWCGPKRFNDMVSSHVAACGHDANNTYEF